MNVTNKNVISNNSPRSINDIRSTKRNLPHFQTVRAGQERQKGEASRSKKRATEDDSSASSILPNYLSMYGALKFPAVHRSNTSKKPPQLVQNPLWNSKSTTSTSSSSTTLVSDRSGDSSVLALLRHSNSSTSNITSIRNKFSLNTNQFTSESENISSSRPMNSDFPTPITPTNSGLQRNLIISSSSNSGFFSTPNKQTTSRTPRTSASRTPKSTSSAVSDSTSQNVVVAITEGRGHARGEVGIAAIDIKRPFLILCQISDTQTYTNTARKINILNPVEILIPNTFYDNMNTNKLYQVLNDQFSTVKLVTVQRKFFNDSSGLQQLQSLCLAEYSSVLPVILRKFYALAAAAALLKYAEFEQNIIFSPKSLRIDYQGGDNVTFIDLETTQKLELVISENVGHHSTSNTLFGVLNNCSTLGGQRRLRALILQPSTDEAEINARLDCVQELIENSEVFFSLKSLLPKFWDVEQLLGLCAQISNLKDNYMAAELQINYALLLKTSLELIPNLKKTLTNTKSKFFCSFLKNLDNEQYSIMLDKIYETLNDDSHLSQKFDVNQFQRCFAVKTGLNSFLDIARIAYSELVQDFNEIVQDLIKDYHLPLVVRMLRSKGPVLQLKITNNNFNIKNLPPVFIQVQKSRSIVTMTTKELLFLKERMNHFVQEIQLLSSVIVFEMLQENRQYIGSLYTLCENIAELDLVVSFTQTSKIFTFVRPTFSEDRMDVRSSVHPILNHVSRCRLVSNDIVASINENMCIITGPNMGGKSIYIRQVALLQIMAQIGCYVPAEYAEFRLTDRIFSRIGFNDSIECNASSFIVEIKEMQYILKSLTPRSLVIVDELCRGTSTEEGTSVAWAISEELIASTAFIFFTTHFIFLTKLQDLYCNVLNYHFEAVEVNSDDGTLPRLMYTHRLVPGVLKLERYGLKLAKSTAIPDSVLETSEQMAKKLSLTWKACSVANENTTKEKRIDNIILKLLQMVDDKTLTLAVIQEITDHMLELNLLSDDVTMSREGDPTSQNQSIEDSNADEFRSGDYDHDMRITDIGADDLFSQEANHSPAEQMNENCEFEETNDNLNSQLPGLSTFMSKDTGYETHDLTPKSVDVFHSRPVLRNENLDVELENQLLRTMPFRDNLTTPMNTDDTEDPYGDEVYYSDVILRNNINDKDWRAYFSF